MSKKYIHSLNSCCILLQFLTLTKIIQDAKDSQYFLALAMYSETLCWIILLNPHQNVKCKPSRHAHVPRHNMVTMFLVKFTLHCVLERHSNPDTLKEGKKEMKLHRDILMKYKVPATWEWLVYIQLLFEKYKNHNIKC